jgi:hypothetical protein
MTRASRIAAGEHPHDNRVVKVAEMDTGLPS